MTDILPSNEHKLQKNLTRRSFLLLGLESLLAAFALNKQLGPSKNAVLPPPASTTPAKSDLDFPIKPDEEIFPNTLTELVADVPQLEVKLFATPEITQATPEEVQTIFGHRSLDQAEAALDRTKTSLALPIPGLENFTWAGLERSLQTDIPDEEKFETILDKWYTWFKTVSKESLEANHPPEWMNIILSEVISPTKESYLKIADLGFFYKSEGKTISDREADYEIWSRVKTWFDSKPDRFLGNPSYVDDYFDYARSRLDPPLKYFSGQLNIAISPDAVTATISHNTLDQVNRYGLDSHSTFQEVRDIPLVCLIIPDKNKLGGNTQGILTIPKVASTQTEIELYGNNYPSVSQSQSEENCLIVDDILDPRRGISMQDLTGNTIQDLIDNYYKSPIPEGTVPQRTITVVESQADIGPLKILAPENQPACMLFDFSPAADGQFPSVNAYALTFTSIEESSLPVFTVTQGAAVNTPKSIYARTPDNQLGFYPDRLKVFYEILINWATQNPQFLPQPKA